MRPEYRGCIPLTGPAPRDTRIQPAVARTIVELGVDMAMPTSGSLSQGLAQAQADRGARR